MRSYGIISYNMHCNFTNYGSALQTYALHTIVNNIEPNKVNSIVIDYCPDILKDKDVLNPMKNMWDIDDESRKMCELSMPAIRENNEKFNRFYNEQYKISKVEYTSQNFNSVVEDENLYGFICGSDTIWCIQEFGGFDDGYFGNYPAMKQVDTVAYAASFGDAVFNEDDKKVLKDRLQNFKAIGIRENDKIEYIKENTNVPVQRVLDPTLLLTETDYRKITSERIIDEPYILLYSRRYNKNMEEYADYVSEKMGCRVVEISLRAVNSSKHIMYYKAGVEEFLSLVKHAECVITNSFHGAIFAIQFHKEFFVFSREQADIKIDELLDLLQISDRKVILGNEHVPKAINYEKVENILNKYRKSSKEYIRTALKLEESK